MTKQQNGNGLQKEFIDKFCDRVAVVQSQVMVDTFDELEHVFNDEENVFPKELWNWITNNFEPKK